MDLISARAQLRALSDLSELEALTRFIAIDPPDDWRRQPIHLAPGWVTLVVKMLDRLLGLPTREQPSIGYIHSRDGVLSLTWRAPSDSHTADAIIIAAIAAAEHACELCGATGRNHRTRGVESTLCLGHSALATAKGLAALSPAELLGGGTPFPRRRVLIDLVIGQGTASRLPAALLNIQGEHAFELNSIYYPAAWLNETSVHADLYAIAAPNLRHAVDHGIFSWCGEQRSFEITEATPLLVEALRHKNQPSETLDLLLHDIMDHDPETRIRAFIFAARLLDGLGTD